MQSLRLLRQIAAMTLPLIGIASGSVAQAADESVAALGPGYSESGAPLGAATELQIDLRGEVAARCRMTSPPALTGRIDLNRAGNARAPFGLDCNAPFQLSVRSGQGGFAAGELREGITPRIAYELALDVDTDAGMNALGWCSADKLILGASAGCAFGAQGWSSGNATAINRMGSLSVRWNAPGNGALPAQGEYRDTITVDVTVRS